MSDSSKIEWTDATWNPVTGCTKVSPGCDHCYAETFAERWRGVPGHHFEQGFDVVLRPERLDQPLRWRTPRRVFVNSMSDLFHEKVPDDYIVTVFTRMWWSPQHTFQVLTKRHGRMRSLLPRIGDRLREMEHDLALLDAPTPLRWPLPNVWLGVSVEDQGWADIRVPALLDTPAAVRFISAEPLLGPVDLIHLATHSRGPVAHWEGRDQINALTGVPRDPSWTPRPGLDWVIVGGESGREARPMHPDWVRSLLNQCQDANVPFFFKQWGEWKPSPIVSDPAFLGGARFGEGEQFSVDLLSPTGRYRQLDDETATSRVGKKRAGRTLDGQTWDQYPAAVTA